MWLYIHYCTVEAIKLYIHYHYNNNYAIQGQVGGKILICQEPTIIKLIVKSITIIIVSNLNNKITINLLDDFFLAVLFSLSNRLSFQNVYKFNSFSPLLELLTTSVNSFHSSLTLPPLPCIYFFNSQNS